MKTSAKRRVVGSAAFPERNKGNLETDDLRLLSPFGPYQG